MFFFYKIKVSYLLILCKIWDSSKIVNKNWMIFHIYDLVHYVTPEENLYDGYLLEYKIRKGENNFFLQINSFKEVCWQRSQLSHLGLRLGKLRTTVQKKCWVKQRSGFSRINQIRLWWVYPGFLLPDSWFWHTE